MSKEPLNFDEHRDLGQELQKTRQHILQLYRMVLDVYGANSRAVFAFEQVNQSVDRLVEELIRQALEDCPGRGADTLYR